MRTSNEILKSVKENNKKSLSGDQIAIRCIRIAIEDTLFECAQLAHPHWTQKRIRKEIMLLANKIT